MKSEQKVLKRTKIPADYCRRVSTLYKNHVKNRVVIPENKCVDTDMIQVTTPWIDNPAESTFDLN